MESAAATEPGAGELSPAEAIRELRRSRARRLGLTALGFVGLPTAAAAVYFGIWATPQYDSTSLFTVQSADSRQSMALDTFLGSIPGVGTSRDTLAARDFILSRDMLANLDREHGLIQHYKEPGIDVIARLPADASFEDAYEYYLDKVQVEHDTNSDVLALRVRAFDANSSQAFAVTILKHTEQVVDRLSKRAREDQTRFAREELKQAEERLLQARHNLLQLQAERSEFNPEQTATAALALRGHLESELAMARAKLSELNGIMQPNAPQVLEQQQRVSALSAQVAKESRRLVSPKAEEGLNASIATFEAAVLEKEFAQGAYQSALTSLEMARSEASRQHRYLAIIAQPSVADEETYPRRLIGVITAFFVSLVALGIGSLSVAAIKEHARL